MLKLYAKRNDLINYKFIEVPESTFLMDGLSLGEELEGVLFEAHFRNNKILSVTVIEGRAKFLTVNTSIWLDIAMKKAQVMLTSENGGEFVDVRQEITDKYFTDKFILCEEINEV